MYALSDPVRPPSRESNKQGCRMLDEPGRRAGTCALRAGSKLERQGRQVTRLQIVRARLDGRNAIYP
eukprot:scaffold104813_cov30-Prasinocladus_malaysianus.AAC.1